MCTNYVSKLCFQSPKTFIPKIFLYHFTNTSNTKIQHFTQTKQIPCISEQLTHHTQVAFPLFKIQRSITVRQPFSHHRNCQSNHNTAYHRDHPTVSVGIPQALSYRQGLYSLGGRGVEDLSEELQTSLTPWDVTHDVPEKRPAQLC